MIVTDGRGVGYNIIRKVAGEGMILYVVRHFVDFRYSRLFYRRYLRQR